ncbi:MAG: hypothetical protein WC530_09855 [Candidatus Omnitrophota bacterium]|jgi:hypothetical protein
MERPTIEIELPVTKDKVVLKSWLTKAEADKTKEPVRTYYSLKHENPSEAAKVLLGEVLEQVESNVVETAVVSIDGVSTGIKEIVADLPEADYDAIIREIDRTVRPPKEPSQKSEAS